MGTVAKAELRAQLARALMLHEDMDEAIVEADLALLAAGEVDHVPVIADALVTKGTAMLDSVHMREGVALLRGAYALATEKHLTATEFRALNNLGTGLSFEDPVGAMALTRDGLLRARRLGYRDWELTLGRVSGALSIGCGTWDETLATLDELERGPVPDDMTVAFSYQRATFALCRGQLAEGERLIAVAVALLPGLSNPTPHAIIEVARSMRHFVRGTTVLPTRPACWRPGRRASSPRMALRPQPVPPSKLETSVSSRRPSRCSSQPRPTGHWSTRSGKRGGRRRWRCEESLPRRCPRTSRCSSDGPISERPGMKRSLPWTWSPSSTRPSPRWSPPPRSPVPPSSDWVLSRSWSSSRRPSRADRSVHRP